MGLLIERTERRAIVEPSGTLAQPSESFVLGVTGGAPASSGVTVTERTAQGIPVVYACDKVIKQDVAKTPIKLKRRNADGTRADDVNHPVYAILHDLANPVMTAYEFKETMQGFLNLWGNAFAEISRGLRNEVTALWPLDSARMTVDLDPLNRLRYTYRMANGRPKEWLFDPANPPIFHLRQNSRDGIIGRSPVQVLREAMGLAVAQDRFEGRFYGQGGHPRTLLSTSQKLTDTAARRIRNDFEELTRGEHNWHRPVVLDHDLKALPPMSNRDAQFLDTVKVGDRRLCGAFRVSPHKISDDERSTFSNVEQIAIEHVGDCLMPHFVCWQQAIARDLLNPKSFNTHFAVFIVDALLRGDAVAVNTMLNLQRQNGVISANQWRKTLDMDDVISVEDGGDRYLVNGTMTPMAGAPVPPAPVDPAVAIEPAMARMIQTIETHAREAETRSRELQAGLDADRANRQPPQVTIAEGAIHAPVTIHPAAVTVHGGPVTIADGAVRSTVEPSPITIHSAPITVPVTIEKGAIQHDAHLTVPTSASSVVEKTVARDAEGRIMSVTEEHTATPGSPGQTVVLEKTVTRDAKGQITGVSERRTPKKE